MMNFLFKILSNEIIEALGLTLVHSLWQGALIAIVLGILMLATRKFTSGTRYIFAVTASLFMLICPVYTFIKTYNPESKYENSAAVAESSEVPAKYESQTMKTERNRIVAGKNAFSLNSEQFKSYFYRHFPLIVTIWLLGILVFTLKFIGGIAYTQRLKYYRIINVSDEWQKKFKELCEKLNIKRTVKIYESALAKVPMVIGLLKPVILLPVSAFTGLSPRQLESIIVHELAHIIRRDYLVNLLQSILEILFFYHPAVWWINGIIRTERENCCDDIAIEQTGDSVNYAKALAGIQEQLLLKENLAMAIAGHKNKLLKRIKRLLNQPKMKTNFIEGFTASCIIFLGIFVIALNANAISEKSADKKSGKSENEISLTQNAEVKDKSTPVSYDLPVIQDTTLETDDQEEIIMDSEEKSTDTKKEKIKEKDKKKYKDKDKDKDKTKEKKVSSDGDEITEEILKGIEQGLVEMDIDLIVDEAMAGVQAGLSEMNLNEIVREAVEASQEGIEELDIQLIVNEVLHGIQAALEEMDLNLILGEAMIGVREALEEIEIEHIVKYEDYDDDDDDADDDMEDDDDNEIDIDCETFIGNMEHLKILKKGVSYWNTWRTENKNEKIDLRGACLKEAKLPNINLSNASLEKINFGEAMLNGADFTEANLEEANLKEASIVQAVFSGANMKGINLKEVALYNIDLRDAVLMYANIKETSMYSVDLRGADLRNANIKEASLQEVDFRDSDLRGADLHEAEILDCKFEGAIVDDTTLFPPGFDTGDKGLEFK